jgi:hypothetical protein
VLRDDLGLKLVVVPELEKLRNVSLSNDLFDYKKVIFDEPIKQTDKINLVLNNNEYTIDKNIYEYPISQQNSSIELYINNEKNILEASPKNLNEIIKLNLANFDNDITYNTDLNIKNQITDGSFEKSLWQDKVGDCNNYDSYPKINFNQNTSIIRDGKVSAELNATRHNACITQKIDVKPGEIYYFSFDYYIKNGTEAGFSFGSPEMKNSDIIFERLKGSPEWGNYNRKIKIPDDINHIYITLYGFQLNDLGEQSSSTLYDNVILRNIPNTEDFAYLLNSKSKDSYNNAEIKVSSNAATLKKINVKSSESPFFLRMSERYSNKWQLKANNIIIDNNNHFELNETVQGWFIDPKTFCTDTTCYKDDEGNYTYNIDIEFIPQKWFNLGLGISGTTLVLTLLYLAYSTMKRKPKNSDDNKSDLLETNATGKELPVVIVSHVAKLPISTLPKNPKMW